MGVRGNWYYWVMENMRVIHCFNLWPMAPFREALRNVFPQVTQERLTSTTLKLSVSQEDADRLTANLDTLHVRWAVLKW